MILGIDTSNYTTSVALIDNKQIIYDGRVPLYVKKGERGLRQSEAFFQHINNLPQLLRAAQNYGEPSAICVSTSPRRLKESYMPCFLAGQRIAEILSAAYRINITAVSHQEGHIQSGLLTNASLEESRFIAVHASGGTTEILLCEKDKAGIKTDIIGGTADISAGQFIDRIGVDIGLDFPCGKEMDKLCSSVAYIKETIPVSVKNNLIYFAGNETKIRNMILNKAEYAEICFAVFKNVADSISKAVKYCCKKNNVKNILFVGGVSSGQNIKLLLSENLKDTCDVYFAERSLCTDNAVGVSALGERLCYEQ